MWSSERETLFLLEKFPGGKGADGVVTEAYQTIDVNVATLGNVVAFSNGNTFVAGPYPFTTRIFARLEGLSEVRTRISLVMNDRKPV